MTRDIFRAPFTGVKNAEAKDLGRAKYRHEPKRDPEHPVGRRSGRYHIFCIHIVPGIMPWIQSGAKPFNLIPPKQTQAHAHARNRN
jgi:hypothetical protein